MGIQIIIGNQGAGKSCYGVIQARKYMKKGYPVFSNLPVKNAFEFKLSDIMKYDFPKDSVLLIDEGASYGLGSRGNQYKKNTTPELVEFFTMHRHYDIKDVIIISPNFTDIIPSVRDNATKVTVVKRGFLSLVGLISKKEVVRSYTIDEMANELKYAYRWRPFSLWWFNPSKAYEHFDSWVRKPLEHKVWVKYSEEHSDFGGCEKNEKFIQKIKKKLLRFKEIATGVKISQQDIDNDMQEDIKCTVQDIFKDGEERE